MATVIGLDLSLTSTGLALVEGGELTAWHCIKSKGKRGASIEETSKRIDDIVYELEGWLHKNVRHWVDEVDLAVIEAPSFGSKGGSAHERGGLWWSVASLMRMAPVPMAKIAPATRAKFITGSGRADKHEVLKAARARWHADIPNHDVADAAGLAFWGYDSLKEG